MTPAEPPIEITYALTWADYRRFQLFKQVDASKALTIALIISGIFAVVETALWAWYTVHAVHFMRLSLHAAGMSYIGFLAWPAIIVIVPILASAIYAYTLSRTPNAFAERTLVASAEYLELRTGASITRSRWSRLTRIAYGRELVMLFTGQLNATIIPAAAFGSVDNARNAASLFRFTGDPTPREIRTDFRVFQFVYPTMSVSFEVSQITKVYARFNQVFITGGTFSTIAVPSRAFGSRDKRDAFLKRLRSAIKEAKTMASSDSLTSNMIG